MRAARRGDAEGQVERFRWKFYVSLAAAALSVRLSREGFSSHVLVTVRQSAGRRTAATGQGRVRRRERGCSEIAAVADGCNDAAAARASNADGPQSGECAGNL